MAAILSYIEWWLDICAQSARQRWWWKRWRLKVSCTEFASSHPSRVITPTQNMALHNMLHNILHNAHYICFLHQPTDTMLWATGCKGSNSSAVHYWKRQRVREIGEQTSHHVCNLSASSNQATKQVGPKVTVTQTNFLLVFSSKESSHICNMLTEKPIWNPSLMEWTWTDWPTQFWGLAGRYHQDRIRSEQELLSLLLLLFNDQPGFG